MPRRLIIPKSYLIAILMSLALVGWMLSGMLPASSTKTPETKAARPPTPAPFSVRVQTSTAQPVTREVVVHGRTAPQRSVTLRAETDGRVVDLGAERGTRVSKGSLIARLDLRDRQAQLVQARAQVSQRELEYAAAKRLIKQGLQSEAKVAEALALLETARAEVKRIEVDLANTEIRAPFDGVLDQRPVEEGDYVSSGDAVATLIDEDPFLVVGDVTEQEVGLLSLDQPATARLVTGETLAGRISYIATQGNEATRTFRVEMEVPNLAHTLAAGVTAEIQVPVNTLPAHYLSSSVLSLNDKGVLGVKTVGEGGVVEFHPARLVRAGEQGVWLADLPETIQVITVGQGFVRAGEQVRALPEGVPPGDAT